MRYLIKSLVSLTRFRRFVFPRWRYNFSAADLVFLCGCLEEVRGVNGSILEVGCEYGETTLFLNLYMSDVRLTKKYYCIDTFDGFTDIDISYEVESRGKNHSNLLGFRNNSKAWFERTLADAGYDAVQVFQKDAAHFDFSFVAPVSLALLDIDLYKPTQACLPRLYDALSPGGLIIVDDCDPSDANYDGAFQAYKEFMDFKQLPAQIFGRKIGVIRKLL